MCPPDFYGIEYEINRLDEPRSGQPIGRTAPAAMACAAAAARRGRGARLSLLPAVAGLARPGVHGQCGDRFIATGRSMARFPPSRAAGRSALRRGLARGARLSRSSICPRTLHFEGAGDALFCGDTLFAGYRIRSDARGHQQIGEMLGCRVIPLELVDPYYYHLDTCFCPLAPGVAIYFPGGVRSVRPAVAGASMCRELIEVSRDEARRFACNAVVVGRTVITNTGCPQLQQPRARRRLSPARNAAGRVRQSRRQREMPDPAARRRRRRRAVPRTWPRPRPDVSRMTEDSPREAQRRGEHRGRGRDFATRLRYVFTDRSALIAPLRANLATTSSLGESARSPRSQLAISRPEVYQTFGGHASHRFG